jgi:hypothetical protein
MSVGEAIRGSEDWDLAERWDGRRWHLEDSARLGRINQWLMSITCSRSRTCTAVGEGYNGHRDVTLALEWHDKTWVGLQVPSPDSFQNGLFGVACLAPIWCMAVGEAGSSAHERALIVLRS